MNKVLNNSELTELEKYQLVKLKTDKLEQRAKEEERVIGVLGTNRGVDRTIEVNDMYIESIKAKLRILD